MTDRPSDVRGDLLEAARAELVERGHAGIGLRAVARRAGVSHAAPGYHFRDRRGLLTALAADGFRAFADALAAADQSLDGLGRAYVDFGLEHPALFDLMFHPTELDPDDLALRGAKLAALGMLSAASDGRARGAVGEDDPPPPLALESWAIVHGLVVLARSGALADAARIPEETAAETARRLVADFASRVAPDRVVPGRVVPDRVVPDPVPPDVAGRPGSALTAPDAPPAARSSRAR